MTIETLKSQNLLLLECISGSKAYGLDTIHSDTDIKGIYFLPLELYWKQSYIPQISNETNDQTYYEIGRFFELCLKSNPNMLELLATPADCILYKNPLLNSLTPAVFLSKQCKTSFSEYAITQIKKSKGLNKKAFNPMPEKRKDLLDFCYVLDQAASIPLKQWLDSRKINQSHCGLSAIAHTKGMYALYVDPAQNLSFKGIINSINADSVALSSIPKNLPLAAYLFCNQEAYSMHCREYREYKDWLSHRNELRYQSNLKQTEAYDAKNMMHTFRLLVMAEEIIKTGTIQVRQPDREWLLSIRSGAYSLEALLEMADTIQSRIEAAMPHSPLPESPDTDAALEQLFQIRKALYL